MNTLEVITFQCFTHEQVKEINKKISTNIVEEEKSSEVASNASKIGNFFYVPCSPLMELLHPWLYQCQQINRNHFGYDVYWNFHLEKFNYNVYGTGGKYEWHLDANTENTPLDSKLTCLLNLSEEPYEGGEFYMLDKDAQMEFTSGMGIVFNSLIAHKLTPVTKGKRISLTYWAQGPSWR
jgi:predicted 2-oxoglutarate/Fe(II)-dependent dioxygenase YbiX